jgi:3-hexulose-6-phosphate synthase/6-phospho-3-hexuloisomerase
MKRRLQVALDMPSIDEALKIGRKAVEGGADIIEAGTPLIKREGISAVRRLKRELGVPTMADLKIIDFGRTEAQFAFDSGADYVTVLGSATTKTIEEAVAVAHSCGGGIAVDLIGVYDVIASYNHVLPLKIDYLYLQSGLGEAVEGKMPLDDVKKLFDVSKIPLGVAGGLDAENIGRALLPGVEVFVVGGAITQARDPATETLRLKGLIKGV